MAPATLGTISQYIMRRGLPQLAAIPHTAPSDPGHTAAVFVALAMIGGTPSQIKRRKTEREPPNANALMALATNPTPKMRTL